MNRKIAIFFGITVALIVYAYFFDYRKTVQDAEREFQEAQLITLNKDQIQEVLIEKSEERILLKRDTTGWRLEEPIKAYADNEAVDLFISTATSESYLEIAADEKSGTPVDWTRYGLKTPKAKITFMDSAGQKVSFDVSAEKNFEQNSFIRRNQENRVLVGTGTWLSRADKSVHELRDKRLLRAKIASVQSLTWTQGKKVLALESRDGKWILSHEPTKTLDQNKVRELLMTLSEAQVQNFLLEKIPSAVEQKKYFLDKPVASLSLKLTETEWNALIALGSDNLYYVGIQNPPSIVRINSEALSKFFQIDSRDLVEIKKEKK